MRASSSTDRSRSRGWRYAFRAGRARVPVGWLERRRLRGLLACDRPMTLRELWDDPASDVLGDAEPRANSACPSDRSVGDCRFRLNAVPLLPQSGVACPANIGGTCPRNR